MLSGDSGSQVAHCGIDVARLLHSGAHGEHCSVSCLLLPLFLLKGRTLDAGCWIRWFYVM